MQYQRSKRGKPRLGLKRKRRAKKSDKIFYVRGSPNIDLKNWKWKFRQKTSKQIQVFKIEGLDIKSNADIKAITQSVTVHIRKQTREKNL